MKKLFIAALLTVTVVASAFTTNDKNVSTKIIENFNSEFADAANVQWSVKPNYVKASFEIRGERTDAFYEHNGESIGCSRKITMDNLPVHAKRIFAKKYSDYVVKEAIVFDSKDETSYFIAAENDRHALVLKVTGAGISTFKKTNKE